MESSVMEKPQPSSSVEVSFEMADPEVSSPGHVRINFVVEYKLKVLRTNPRGEVVDSHERTFNSTNAFLFPEEVVILSHNAEAVIRDLGIARLMPRTPPSIQETLSQNIISHARTLIASNNVNSGGVAAAADVKIVEVRVQSADEEVVEIEPPVIREGVIIGVHEHDHEVQSRGLSQHKIEEVLKREIFIKDTTRPDLDADGESSCLVCWEEYLSGAEITSLPCYHTFHRACLDTWLKKNANCPICQLDIPKQPSWFLTVYLERKPEFDEELNPRLVNIDIEVDYTIKILRVDSQGQVVDSHERNFTSDHTFLHNARLDDRFLLSPNAETIFRNNFIVPLLPGIDPSVREQVSRKIVSYTQRATESNRSEDNNNNRGIAIRAYLDIDHVQVQFADKAVVFDVEPNPPVIVNGFSLDLFETDDDEFEDEYQDFARESINLPISHCCIGIGAIGLAYLTYLVLYFFR